MRGGANLRRTGSASPDIPLSQIAPTIRRRRWQTSSTAPYGDHADTIFEIVHPHHRLRGQRFKLVTYRQNWGEDRVYFYNAEGRLSSLPARWTTVPEEDPFVAMAGDYEQQRLKDRIAISEQRRASIMALAHDFPQLWWNPRCPIASESAWYGLCSRT